MIREITGRRTVSWPWRRTVPLSFPTALLCGLTPFFFLFNFTTTLSFQSTQLLFLIFLRDKKVVSLCILDSADRARDGTSTFS